MENYCVHIKVKLVISKDLRSSKKKDQYSNCIMLTKCLFLYKSMGKIKQFFCISLLCNMGVFYT